MSKVVNFILVALAALVFCAYIEARATPIATPAATPVSFLDDMKLSYNAQKDVWQCDMLTCPNKTVGCRMLRYNDVNKTSSVWRVNHCYNSLNFVTYSLYFEQINLSAGRKVDVNITSFRGDLTELVYGYTNTSQTVKGTVRWEDFPNVQRQYREIIAEASPNKTINPLEY